MKYHVSFDIDLKRNPYKGLYVAIEGIDGSGKTTQAQSVAQELKKRGKNVVITEEPWDDGFVGGIIRDNILSGKTKLSPVALQHLFVADRADHLEKVVIPALKNGQTVITDRYFWSAIPYGLLDRGDTNYSNSEVILAAYCILSFYHQFIVPNYTFYLDVSLDTAMKRITQKDEKIELYEKREKLEKVKNGYDWLAKKFASEIAVINGEKSIEEVTDEILSRIMNQES